MEKSPQSKKSFAISIVSTVVVLAVAAFLYFGNSLARLDSFFMGLNPSVTNATSTTTGAAPQTLPALPALPALPSLPAASAAATPTSSGSGLSGSGSAKGTSPAAPAPQPTIKTLPYSVTNFKSVDWIQDWGTVSTANGLLSFGASASTTGGAVFLAGASAWTNYNFQAYVDWIRGVSFSIIARETDPSDFTYCDFGAKDVNVVQRTADVDRTVNSAPSPNGGADGTYEFGIRVYADDVACTVNGQDVATAALGSGAPAAGGIGFISWDTATGTSAIVVRNLQVSPLTQNNIVVPYPAPQPVAPAPTSTVPAPVLVPTSTNATPPTPSSTPAIALALPYAETGFAGDANWTATWGAFAIDPASGDLVVEATGTTTGASVFLENSAGWSNYKFDASVDWAQGQTFAIIANYVDDKNFVACEYDWLDRGDVQVQLEQYVNGQQNILETGSFGSYYPAAGSFADAYIKVNNTTGICSLDGHQITNQTPDAYVINAPFVGGIGFEVWDPTPGFAKTIVQNINVTPN